jgi:hypothetical protein
VLVVDLPHPQTRVTWAFQIHKGKDQPKWPSYFRKGTNWYGSSVLRSVTVGAA